MAEQAQNQIDAFTNKYTEGFEKFSNSKSGNVIVDFVLFKRNIVPYTLQIVFILGVLLFWGLAIAGILGQGPIADGFCHAMVKKEFVENGKTIEKTVEVFLFMKALGIGVGVIVGAPFILHYILELIKICVWPLGVHIFNKILVPIWNTLFVRFLANVMPQILPFLYERFMKTIDILLSKLEPALDAQIGMGVAFAMTLIGVMKGIVWLPKKLYQWIGRVLDKSAVTPAAPTAPAAPAAK